MTALKQHKNLAIALFAAVGFAAIAALEAKAAIVIVNDSGSWINGANTLENQGFNLIPVLNGTEALGADLSILNLPLGDVEFGSSANNRQVGNGWLTWSNGYQGKVYYAGADVLTLDIKLPNLAAFDFYAQPDFQQLSTIAAIAKSGEISDLLSQTVNGNAGAKYFGFYSDDPLDPIQSIQITAAEDSGGFAIAQMRGATAKVPVAPVPVVPVPAATVPTPLLLPGLIGLGLGLWRKARSRVL